ncbi:hypothetical protein HN814_07680, partial [Candidatus Woesearchaeota archaeon]|nr:hypothetical protein [Candidatus Woesearchaeota archaeon]
MVANETQRAIVQDHLGNEYSLLKKYDGGRIGSDSFDHSIFSTYELIGFSDGDVNIYLPHFEFNVGSGYCIEINRDAMLGETIYHEQDCTRLNLYASDGSGLVDVSFPRVKGLFELRNLAKSGQLLTIPQVAGGDRGKLPIHKSQVRADFSFRISSMSYGQLFARMEIDHPAAEEVIMAY